MRFDQFITRFESIKLQDYKIINIEFLFVILFIMIIFLFLLYDDYGIMSFIATISEILGQFLDRFRHAFNEPQKIGNFPRFRNIMEFIEGESNEGLENIIIFMLDYEKIIDSSFIFI